jgi:hypothetical protein
MIGLAGVAAGAGAIGAAVMPPMRTPPDQPRPEPHFQLIEHLIIKHGGDCCGCAVSKEDGEVVCNECGQTLDVLVSEVAYLRVAEALMRAHHALTASSGLVVHDGKPEHSYSIDHSKEITFIEDAMQLADIDFRAMKPLV